MEDIEDLIMPEAEAKEDRIKRLEAVRRHFLKKELENKSSEMIENQKIFLKKKFKKMKKLQPEEPKKESAGCAKDDCCQREEAADPLPKNDFCGSEHDDWQPDMLLDKCTSPITIT